METIKDFCSQSTIDLTEIVDKFPDLNNYLQDLSFQQVQQFINVPTCFKVNKIAEINQTHKIVLFKGTVIRTGIAKSMSKYIQYKCKECQFVMQLQSDSTNYFINENQLKCTNDVIKQSKYNPFFKQKPKGFKKQKCNSTQFEKLEDTKLIDYQEIKVQDTYTKIEPGTISNSIKVMLEDQFVNNCNSGDDVIIGGLVTQRWKMFRQKPQISLWIDCKYLKLQKQTQLCQNIDQDKIISKFQHRNEIINSFIPELCNYWPIKLGVLLSLIGGVTKTNNGITARGDSHLLLIGEPGTGKSTILRNACNISEKSLYVNGIGTTQAGLTLSFVKEGADWMIEAGALVMTDQGLCCIDEFNLLSQQSQQSILEALEQQTISSSKAGISTKLNARTTLIAACVPIEQIYNSKLTIQYNSGLSSPLLSRFDQIYVLKDQHDIELDKQLCDHFFNFGHKKQNYTQKQLKQYISYVKNNYNPIMNEECQQAIQKYFTFIRQSSFQVTARKFESLIRLSEAHARLCSKQEIDEFDVVTVIALIESSQFSGFYPDFQEVLSDKTKPQNIQDMWEHLQNY